MNTQTPINNRAARSIRSCLGLGAAAWVAGVAGLALVPVAQAQCLPPFAGSAPDWHAGFATTPNGIAAADLDGDGFMDLVVSQASIGYDNPYMLIMWGRGDSTFDETRYFQSAAGTGNVVIADLNGDHLPDIGRGGDGLVEFAAATVVFYNQGSRNFDCIASHSYDPANGALSVAYGDLTGDGIFDIVVAEPQVNVGTGVGNGTFDIPRTANYPMATAVLLGQLRQNAPLDLMMVHSTQTGVIYAVPNTVSVSQCDGHGAFGPRRYYPVGDDPQHAALGDLNNDSIPDLVVANRGSHNISVLLGDGQGGFLPAVQYDTGGGAVMVDIGDINADGVPDLAVANQVGDSYAVFLGAGDGVFGPPMIFPLGLFQTSPSAAAIGDFDGNGFGDLATTYLGTYTTPPDGPPYLNSDGGMVIFMNAGMTSIQISSPPISQRIAPGTDVSFSVAASSTSGEPVSYQWRQNGIALNSGVDFSGVSTATLTIHDASIQDVGSYEVLVTGCPAEAPVLRAATLTLSPPPPQGMCDVAFAAPLSAAVGPSPTFTAVSDMNGDGMPDLIASNFFSEYVSIAMGTGNGAFAAPTSYPLGGRPWGMAIGDLNGDGNPDLAIANHTTARATIMLSNSLGQLVAQYQCPTGAGPISIALGDFNGDGTQDLATANYVANNVSVLIGVGNGQFLSATNFAVGTAPASIAAADLNGDGRLDLVIANSVADNVSMLLGNGDGAFAVARSVTSGNGPTSVALGDVNSDGRIDIVTSNYADGAVSVLLGNGDSTFASPLNFPAGSGPRHVSIGDLNGDRRPDLAVSNFVDNSVSVLLGHGDGLFAPSSNWTTGAGPSCTAIADLNRDNRPDLAVANMNENTISVLLSNGPNIGFQQHPRDQSVAPGASATFTVTPAGEGPFMYQWRRGGLPIAGATLSTLTIANVTSATLGSYDVQVRGGCNQSSVATSSPALLTFADSTCIADANHDQVVNSQDFFYYLSAFFAGCP